MRGSLRVSEGTEGVRREEGGTVEEGVMGNNAAYGLALGATGSTSTKGGNANESMKQAGQLQGCQSDVVNSEKCCDTAQSTAPRKLMDNRKGCGKRGGEGLQQAGRVEPAGCGEAAQSWRDAKEGTCMGGKREKGGSWSWEMRWLQLSSDLQGSIWHGKGSCTACCC